MNIYLYTFNILKIYTDLELKFKKKKPLDLHFVSQFELHDWNTEPWES